MTNHSERISSEVVIAVATWGNFQADPNNPQLLEKLGKAFSDVREDMEMLVAPKQEASGPTVHDLELRNLRALISGVGGSEAVFTGRPQLSAGPDALGYSSPGKEFVFDRVIIRGQSGEARLIIPTVIPFSVVQSVRPAQSAEKS